MGKGGRRVCYELSLILYIHDKKTQHDNSECFGTWGWLPFFAGKWKSQEVRPLSHVFLSFDSCFITGYYYFSLSGALFAGLFMSWGFSAFCFQSSTFHAYFANELEGREAKGRIHAQIIVICYLPWPPRNKPQSLSQTITREVLHNTPAEVFGLLWYPVLYLRPPREICTTIAWSYAR